VISVNVRLPSHRRNNAADSGGSCQVSNRSSWAAKGALSLPLPCGTDELKNAMVSVIHCGRF
jgi:hypothetical protein